MGSHKLFPWLITVFEWTWGHISGLRGVTPVGDMGGQCTVVGSSASLVLGSVFMGSGWRKQ